MKPYQINTITGIVLLVMSLWAYLGSNTQSLTALIPGIFGVIFLALSGPFKNENKVVAHIIVALTFVLLISLFKPLMGVLERDDTLGLIRVVTMMAVALVALTIYVRSFRDARRRRA